MVSDNRSLRGSTLTVQAPFHPTSQIRNPNFDLNYGVFLPLGGSTIDSTCTLKKPYILPNTVRQFIDFTSICGWTFTGADANTFVSITNGITIYTPGSATAKIPQALAIQFMNGFGTHMTVSQHIFLQPGFYATSFYASPRPSHWDSDNQITASLNGASVKTAFKSHSGWQLFSFTATITECGSYPLSFLFVHKAGYADTSTLLTGISMVYSPLTVSPTKMPTAVLTPIIIPSSASAVPSLYSVAAFEGNVISMSVDAAGNVYTIVNNQVVVIAIGTGLTSVVAGTNALCDGSNHYCYSGDGGPATSATLNGAFGLALDTTGNIYIADELNHAIRMVTASTGYISTVAGGNGLGFSGDGGLAILATLKYPRAVCFDTTGNMYISDSQNYVIRMVSAGTGIISTVAGTGRAGGYSGDGGLATSAKMIYPYSVAVDTTGNLYITDSGLGNVRMVSAGTGIISTVADLPRFINAVVDTAGNLYVGDSSNNCLLKSTVSTGIITTFVGNGTQASSDLPDGTPAHADTAIGALACIAVDISSKGYIYIAEDFGSSVFTTSIKVIR